MKQILSYIFFGLSILCLIASVAWGIRCVADQHAIANDPSASGIDYLGLGFFYALGFLICGIPGFVFSVLSGRKTAERVIVTISRILTFLFAISMIGAFCLWAFGPGHF